MYRKICLLLSLSPFPFPSPSPSLSPSQCCGCDCSKASVVPNHGCSMRDICEDKRSTNLLFVLNLFFLLFLVLTSPLIVAALIVAIIVAIHVAINDYMEIDWSAKVGTKSKLNPPRFPTCLVLCLRSSSTCSSSDSSSPFLDSVQSLSADCISHN